MNDEHSRSRPSGGPGPRGPGPWLVLVGVALVPALLLYGIAVWAAPGEDADAAAPETEPTVEVPAPGPALSTPIIGLRRLPTVMSRSINIDEFRMVVNGFTAGLNERSCAMVSLDGVLVGEHNAAIPVIPASTQKLPVAAVALEVLGADHRYTTTVAAASAPVEGKVDGDLYLVGGGDPLLSSNWYPESNIERLAVTTPTSLDTLADSVAAAGVQRITGSVIGDGSRYDDEYFAPGWGPGVAGLESGPYDAVMVNDSRVLGDEIKSNDPSESAAGEFTRLLRDRDIEIGGTPAAGVAPAATVELATIESAPLSDVVAELLATSDNNTAELLVKEIAASKSTPGTREAGLAIVGEHLAAWGVDVEPIVLVDGSGLSVDDRLTCDALIAVLQRSGPETPLGQGLPVAAESGTLKETFTEHELAGRLTGKTGTLNNPPFNADPPAVKSLAGFLPIDGGSVIEYALVLNGPTVSDQSEYRPIWEDLANALATYPSGPTPAELGPR